MEALKAVTNPPDPDFTPLDAENEIYQVTGDPVVSRNSSGAATQVPSEFAWQYSEF